MISPKTALKATFRTVAPKTLLLLPQESSSDEQPVCLVHLQDTDRRSPYSGYPHDARSVHCEVFLPDIRSRIEQADRLTGFGVEAAILGPL